MFQFLTRINSCDGRYSDSLDVRFTKQCDNRCSFCIEKEGVGSFGQPQVTKMIQSTLASKKTTVLILGGEPFLNVDALNEYVKGIRPFVKEIFITTSIPKTLDLKNPTVVEILDVIDGLNVSIHHDSPIANNEILNATSRFDRIARLGTILSHEPFACKVRVNVNLCRGFIESREDICRFVIKMEQLKCQQVKLNELQSVGEDCYVSFEEVFGIRLKSPYAFGCQTDVSSQFSTSMTIILKRACFKVQPRAIAERQVTIVDILKLLVRKIKPIPSSFLVLYENGQLSQGWKQSETKIKNPPVS